MTRVAFTTAYTSAIDYLNTNLTKKNKLQEQLSTGQAINRPSDDPVGFAYALGYNTSISERKQNISNMDDGLVYLDATDTVLTSMDSLYQRTRELAVQASNDTNGKDERLYINNEVRERLNEMLALSNTKQNGNYIFAGTWTDQKPYEIKDGTALFDAVPTVGGGAVRLYDANYEDPNVEPGLPNTRGEPLVQRIIPGSFSLTAAGGAVEGTDYEVDYVNGTVSALTALGETALAGGCDFEYVYRNSSDTSGALMREVESGMTVQVNLTSDDFIGKDGDMDAFKSVISLMEGLWENDQPAIADAIVTLDDGAERNCAMQALTGARINRMESVGERAEDRISQDTTNLDSVASIDWAEAFSSYTLAETVYNASLKSAAKMMQTSLMDYI